MDLWLRDVVESDLPVFFEQQADAEANRMAAFTRKNPADRAGFDAHWTMIRADESVTIKTIIFQNQVAGHVASYGPVEEKEVTYWIGREYWGKGVATKGLLLFLDHLTLRPLYARAAKDNLASIRVLEKCGFIKSGEDKYFANARGEEIDEVVMKLH
jgi:RimJ/RimL family protein N-acetyltransferase